MATEGHNATIRARVRQVMTTCHTRRSAEGQYASDVAAKDADGKVLKDGSDAVRVRYARSVAEEPAALAPRVV